MPAELGERTVAIADANGLSSFLHEHAIGDRDSVRGSLRTHGGERIATAEDATQGNGVDIGR
jgi:hypothetical protein